MNSRVNLSMVPSVSVVESSRSSRLRDFMRINPPIFHVSKVGEDSQQFLDSVYNVLSAMGLHL